MFVFSFLIILFQITTYKMALANLQARLQQCVNQELQMFKLDVEKAEEPEIKLSTSFGS